MENVTFRLDRTAFHAGTHTETGRYHVRHRFNIMTERLQAAIYLNSVAFNYDLNNPPRLDRTAFAMRKHKNG